MIIKIKHLENKMEKVQESIKSKEILKITLRMKSF